jgi:hypothetical protein
MATAGDQFVDLGGVSVHVPKLTQSQKLIVDCRDGGDAECQPLAKATNNKLVTQAEVAKRDAEIEALQTKIKAQAASEPVAMDSSPPASGPAAAAPAASAPVAMDTTSASGGPAQQGGGVAAPVDPVKSVITAAKDTYANLNDQELNTDDLKEITGCRLDTNHVTTSSGSIHLASKGCWESIETGKKHAFVISNEGNLSRKDKNVISGNRDMTMPVLLPQDPSKGLGGKRVYSESIEDLLVSPRPSNFYELAGVTDLLILASEPICVAILTFVKKLPQGLSSVWLFMDFAPDLFGPSFFGAQPADQTLSLKLVPVSTEIELPRAPTPASSAKGFVYQPQEAGSANAPRELPDTIHVGMPDAKVLQRALEGALYTQTNRECSGASFYNMYLLNRLRLGAESELRKLSDLGDFCGRGVDADTTETQTLARGLGMGVFFLDLQTVDRGVRTFSNGKYLVDQGAFTVLSGWVLLTIRDLPGTGLIVENTPTPQLLGVGNHYTAMVYLDGNFHQFDSMFPNEPKPYSLEDAEAMLWDQCTARRKAGALCRMVVTVDARLDNSLLAQVYTLLQDYINDSETAAFPSVSVIDPRYEGVRGLSLSPLGRSLQAACTYGDILCNDPGAVFSNNDLREVSETTVNGVEVVVAKRDIVSTLPGNRCCAIVEDDEDYKFSACATFVQNPVEAGLIEPKAVVAAKDHKETKTAYTRLLANGGLASKLGISDTVVFVGSEHTASCVRQVVLNFSVPLRRIVIVYTNAQDDLYQGAKSEIAEIPGGGGDVSSSPSPPEVATSDADALAQQAAVQAQGAAVPPTMIWTLMMMALTPPRPAAVPVIYEMWPR